MCIQFRNNQIDNHYKFVCTFSCEFNDFISTSLSFYFYFYILCVEYVYIFFLLNNDESKFDAYCPYGFGLIAMVYAI